MVKVKREKEQKFKELILYISQKCASDATFGATKLNKILFYSDFFAYGRLGEAITGFEYQNLPEGPAPRRLLPIRDNMIEAKELGIQTVPLKSGANQKRPVNLRDPDLKLFSGGEIAIVDQVIEALWEIRAEDVSDLSHKMVGWIVTKEGETIPYSTVFLSNEPLNDMEIKRGKELANTYDLAI